MPGRPSEMTGRRVDGPPGRPQASELAAFAGDVSGCTRCRLAEGRTQVVFGSGDPNANLMFVGEAPGFHEDQQGLPFVGRAGQLLDELLAEIGLDRSQVFVANVLKCRPPGNRDPQPEEIETCRPYLWKQVELIEPKVICTLGNFATKLLTRSNRGITQVAGKRQEAEIGGRRVVLYPLFHPAAALRTPATKERLRQDFAGLPALLEEAIPQPSAPEPAPAVVPQLGLFG